MTDAVWNLAPKELKWMDVPPGRFPSVFYKGDNFCDFMFTFLHTKIFPKRDLL